MTEKVGRYEILDEIGQGGFAIVYRARDTVLDRLVALKELRPALLGDTARVKRFQREARMIARLDHPRIVPIYDVDEVEGRLFIVMRLVDGPSLAELITRRRCLPWPEAVEITTAVAEALDYAHSQDILHRDLKPANILLDPERGPLLSDFGLAKLVGESSISVSGDIVGTPHYIAPEAWEGVAATPQMDIYALGCILYEMLIGENIFQGETPVAVMSAHLKPLELPETWPEGVPAGVANVLRVALARKPANRYATAGEMARELTGLAADEAAGGVQEKADDLLEIFTFGGLQLQRGGEPVTSIGSRRVEALFTCLACTGRPQPREVLADLLWDDRPQRQAMSNLRTVLTGLRKHLGPYVTITRETVALNPETNVWLDVAEMTEKLASLQEQGGLTKAEMAAQAEAAVALYRGDFLEGFHLRGALGFEEWLTVERENLRQQVLDALSELIIYHLAQGSYKAGISHARQLLQLDPLLEEAHQQLMRLLTYSGQRAAALAQYETCRRIMAEEFGVEPAAETTTLFEQIQAGTLEPPPPAPVPSPDISPKLPAFLSVAPLHPSPPALFVAREQELAQLNQYLAEALDSHGRVIFVTGEAGRGKTALLAEFARRAQADHAKLIVANGNCNAYSGLGDPYLPFRDVMGILSGEVESKWAAGAITRDHACRLWRLLPHTVQTLIEEGPNLLDVFVSGTGLVKRVTANFPDGTSWLERLKELAERAKAGSGDLEQRQLFEQYTQVLHTLSIRQPLLLLLDDLQWADSASVNLLFHLVRRLQDSRILIVGAYRSSEVTLGQPALSFTTEQAQRHPLEPVINEFKSLFGEIELDLGKIPAAEGRAFVEALLDSEPNRLGEAFRAALFRQTKGHPLFTIELLRETQERGDLVQDEAGRWVEGPTLDWNILPVRVEAIIDQRLGRLDEELRDILTVASVEGEVFTAQIVAQMQEMGERQVLRRLSRELVQRHRLVRDQGEVEVDGNRLSRFQFRHVLFQQYLYDRLSPGERRLLHGEMATLLEELYQDQTNEIAIQLARHYVEAGQGEKAVDYLLQAGDQARLAYAHEAAIGHYRQALIFLKEQGDDERAARTLMKLGLTYHNAFDFEQSRLAYEEAFALRQVAGQMHPFAQPSTPHTFRVLWPDDPPTLDPALTIDYSPIVGHLFSGLVATTPELDVVPDVAQRWEILDGGRKYIFHLRDDIRWSDGVPVTAHDFEYAWKRILAPRPATGSSAASLLYDVKGARAFHRGEAGPEAVGARALDAVTLAIELEGPVGHFLSLLTYSITYPVPRHTVETHGEDWTAIDKIVTNGPFRLESWQRGERLVLTRNEMYHGRFQGNVEKVECLFLGGDIWSLADWDTRSLALYETGDLDVMRIAEAVGQARQKYAQDHVSFPMFWTIYVSFDLSQPPFDDLRVRRAFALAIDSARYQREVTKGLFAPATGGFLPPQMPGYSAGIGLPYDPAEAQRLLAEAGYPDGHCFPKVKALGGTKQEAEYVQAQWRENLGVEVEWDVLDIVTAHEMASREIPALFFVAWGAYYPDPDSFLRVCFQQPYHNWYHEAYNSLVEEARQLTDQEQRLKLYQQADRILMEQIPFTPLFYGRLHFLVKPWVRNLRIAPTWETFWKDVIIEPSQQPEQPKPTSIPSPTSFVLRMDWPSPRTLDPTLVGDFATGTAIFQLFSGLGEQTPEMEVVPDLARKWEILAAGQKYLFHLRDDVRWSDGVPVTAGDFEYAWKRVLNPTLEAAEASTLYDIKGARAFHQGGTSDPDQVGVRALNDLTLMVELEEPTGYFLQLLVGCCAAFPVPRHVVEAHGEAWAAVNNIVTNGPFKLAAWQPGRSLILVRNPAYHGQFRGNVQQLELLSNVSKSTSLAQYEAGELDHVSLGFSPQELIQARQRYPEEYLTWQISNTVHVGFDTSRIPFHDRRVRRALAMAIDKETLADRILHGMATPARGGFVPPGMPGHSAEIGLPYDPVQAQRLLAEAGYPGGKEFPDVEFLSYPRYSPVGEYLQTQWQENLGIKVNWRVVEWPEFIKRQGQEPPPISMWAWLPDYPDPDNFLRVCLNREKLRWRNETYDRLLKEARRITDHEMRIKLYQQADKILVEEAAVLPICYWKMHWLMKPRVRQFPIASNRWLYAKDVIIEPH